MTRIIVGERGEFIDGNDSRVRDVVNFVEPVNPKPVKEQPDIEKMTFLKVGGLVSGSLGVIVFWLAFMEIAIPLYLVACIWFMSKGSKESSWTRYKRFIYDKARYLSCSNRGMVYPLRATSDTEFYPERTLFTHYGSNGKVIETFVVYAGPFTSRVKGQPVVWDKSTNFGHNDAQVRQAIDLPESKCPDLSLRGRDLRGVLLKDNVGAQWMVTQLEDAGFLSPSVYELINQRYSEDCMGQTVKTGGVNYTDYSVWPTIRYALERQYELQLIVSDAMQGAAYDSTTVFSDSVDTNRRVHRILRFASMEDSGGFYDETLVS